ncbi:MAG: molybdate ABC transporter substrate-binding protein [Candidatus Thiodiazotropha endolucinida]|nr:molybdate ABC transporter substrate-binding protein [Candidatus Thiodiazotropha endolucinida]
MKYRIHHLIPALFLGLTLCAGNSSAGVVKVAVAANFTAAMREIVQDFEQSSGHKVLVSYGSTGKLYTQILHNAPFELFLAADQERPQLLESKQLADDRFTYAIGKLVLWSSDKQRKVNAAALKQGEFDRIALANPKTAPYGAAAVSVMQKLGIDEALTAKRVQGDSIAQTYQFVATGNVEMGFVAQAQVALIDAGRSWEIPQDLYTPIRQDAVLLERGRDNPAALELHAYLQQEAATSVIHRYGYITE